MSSGRRTGTCLPSGGTTERAGIRRDESTDRGGSGARSGPRDPTEARGGERREGLEGGTANDIKETTLEAGAGTGVNAEVEIGAEKEQNIVGIRNLDLGTKAERG